MSFHMNEEELREEDGAAEKGEDVESSPLQKVEAELKDYKDKYLRLLAEMENARKRMQKEKQEAIRFAVENLLADILTPLDNFENALQSSQQMSEETKRWAVGFQMILSQFKELLQQYGVSAFHAKGDLFDPHLHDAVETEETDLHPEGTVVHEFLRGYKCGDRTIRHARVKVAKPLNKEN
jgi:molecular chaperone GrpE